MSDNPLKAVVEAIAESDNEIGGTLSTRLNEAHVFGQNDAFISVAVVNNRIESLVDIWTAGMVGLEVDVICKATPTGNEGRYLISAYENARSIRVTTILGAVVVFVAEDPVIWRLGTLRVETTWDFLNPPTTTETVGQLWVGAEPAVVTYAARTLVPGSNSFDQLGDYLTGAGYLTVNHREDTEVAEARRGYSDLDKLRRALLVAYAEDEELDRIGRNLGRGRPRGFADAAYRRILQVVPYAPRGTVYSLELLLAALYPTATPAEIREMIYEDFGQHHNTVFLLLPDTEPGTESEGRTFLNPSGVTGTVPGREGELQTSLTALTFGTAQAAVTVWKVLLQAVEQDLACLVLPSAEAPAWPYVSEGAAEGATFAIAAGYGLLQSMVGTNLGGRYQRAAITAIGSEWVLETFWLWTGTVTAGRPWHLSVHDGSRTIALFWDEAGLQLHDLAGAIATATFAFGYNRWHKIRLSRRGGQVYAEVDGQVVVEAPASSFAATAIQDAGFGYRDVGAGAQTWVSLWKEVHLYSYSSKNYWNLSRTDGALVATVAVLTSAATLFLAANGDAGKLVRLSGALHRNTGLWVVTASTTTTLTLEGVLHVADASVSGKDGDLTDPWIAVPPNPGTATRQGSYNGALIRTTQARFCYEDGPATVGGVDGKYIEISGSAGGVNDGTYQILEVIDPWTVRVSYAAGFTNEASLDWRFSPHHFDNEVAVPWELIATGSNGGTSHILREALPAATTPIEVCYTDILSAQLLLNEFVVNEGSGGGVGKVFYPFYLLDVSAAIRQLIEDMTAAGVIAEYRRGY